MTALGNIRKLFCSPKSSKYDQTFQKSELILFKLIHGMCRLFIWNYSNIFSKSCLCIVRLIKRNNEIKKIVTQLYIVLYSSTL